MRALLGLSLFFVAFAGCSGSPSPDDDDPAFEDDTYTLTITDFPTAVLIPGDPFNFTLEVAGALTTNTDHIGAHFGKSSGTAPSTTFYNMQCQHQSGELPGTFTVECVAPSEQGVFYLRGHTRVTEDQEWNWWSEEHTFSVAGPVEE